MKRSTFFLTALFLSLSAVLFANDKHEMENYHASIDATAHKNARFVETKTVNGKEYVYGKGTSYNKKGEAVTGKALWPYAEYSLASKTAGGKYNLTIYYRIDKNKIPDNPRILVGLDLQEAQELEIKSKVINTVKVSFDAKLLKGKSHTIKLWLPSEGVEIQKIEVRRSLLTILKKKDKE